MGKAFEEWKSLFAESAVNVWNDEREELRKASMLIHILGLELTRIKKYAEDELDVYRKSFESKTTKENKFLSPNKVLQRRPSLTQKENKTCGITPLTSISNRSDRFKQSHVSPDLFNLESPDLSKNIKTIEPLTDEDEIASTQIQHVSPKINRRRYLRLKKNKETAKTSSCRRALEKRTPENIKAEEIVENTPEVSQRKATQKKGSILKLQSRTGKDTRVRLFNNTLTQMYANIPSGIKNKKEKSISQSGEVDSDATTICEIQEESPRLNNIIEDDVMIEDDCLSKFFIDYDKVPERKKSLVDPKKEKCKMCTKHVQCPKHREKLTQEHKSFTGFWDIDFTVDDPMEETQVSTIF